jgi:hypothetical protein
MRGCQEASWKITFAQSTVTGKTNEQHEGKASQQ